MDATRVGRARSVQTSQAAVETEVVIRQNCCVEIMKWVPCWTSFLSPYVSWIDGSSTVSQDWYLDCWLQNWRKRKNLDATFMLIEDVRWWLLEAHRDLICKPGPLLSAWNEKGEQRVVPCKRTKTQEIPRAGRCAWEVTTSLEQYTPKRTMVTSVSFCHYLGAVWDQLSHQNTVECSVPVLCYSMKVLGHILPVWETVTDIHFIYVPHLPYIPVLFVTAMLLGHWRRLWVERLLDPMKKWDFSAWMGIHIVKDSPPPHEESRC